MFKIGQKVVCVEVDLARVLVIGRTYKVTSIDSQCECSLVGVNNMPAYTTDGAPAIPGELVKCPICRKLYNSNGLSLFQTKRFRPIDETFAESVLENITEQIKEEELTLI